MAGLAAAPANALPGVLKKAAFIAARSGGNGAVRELVDAILLVRQPAPALT
jgi:3-deoxy-D-manno-octulosonate 8-phosphate phosphatase KdsC-like HAD superfamily phosphatase